MRKSNLILKKMCFLFLMVGFVFLLVACEGEEEMKSAFEEEIASIDAATSFKSDVDYELLDGTKGTLSLSGMIDDVVDPIYNNYKNVSFSPKNDYADATFYLLAWSIYSEADYSCLIRVSIVDEIVLYEMRPTGETETIDGVEVEVMEKVEIERRKETVWLTDENGESISLKADKRVDYFFELEYKIADYSEKSSFTFELIDGDKNPIEIKWAVDGFDVGASTFEEENEEE